MEYSWFTFDTIPSLLTVTLIGLGVYILFLMILIIPLGIDLGILLSAVFGLGGTVVVCFMIGNSAINNNSDIIRDEVAARYGEFTPIDDGQRLKPETEYQIKLHAKPNEFCLLNTASTPQDLTVKCGTLTTPTQQ